MGRQVKCIDTKEKADSNLCYKSPDGRYFSSESGYLQWDLNKTCRLKAIDLMYLIMQYNPQQKIPTYFYKKLKEWEWYGYDVVYNAMNHLQSQFDYARTNKHFTGEMARTMYYCAMIENQLNDEYKTKIKINKSLKKKDDNIIDFSDFKETRNSISSKNITKWLGDDDD